MPIIHEQPDVFVRRTASTTAPVALSPVAISPVAVPAPGRASAALLRATAAPSEWLRTARVSSASSAGRNRSAEPIRLGG